MKTPEQMTAEEYARLGLRSGLEIHQQLCTRRKLFCRCPVRPYSPHYDAEILRHMRPTLSELGEYDPTALMEFKTRKEIVYRLNRDTVCTYEMDDAPPFELNPQALDIALEITMLLGCQLVGELHISRKQYLDGSIPTGFQRTTILGIEGAIPYAGRRIGIIQLGLEEDACREVSDRGHTRTYLTDRLSLPLIEMVTYPDMHTPREVAGVAERLRWLSRATGKVRRGAGACRQDVNVSVSGGARCEIKGVHRIPAIPRLVHYEALRQKALLDLRDLLGRRGLSQADFRPVEREVTGWLKHTSFAPLRAVLAAGGSVRAVLLPRFAGALCFETAPGAGFVRELEGRVRVIACLDGRPNLAHSDAAAETLGARAFERLQRLLSGGSDDAVVVIWGPPRDLVTATAEVAARAREALGGVPRETRQALDDGSTGFERLLPGPDRMYPDTDLPPVALTEERIARVRASLPALPWVEEERYARLGLHAEVIRALLRSGRGGFVARIAAAGRSKPVLAAVLVSQVLRALRRKGVQVERLNDDALAVLLELHAGCAFGREALPAILSALTARGAEEAAPEVARPADQPPGQEVEQPAGQVVGQVVGQGVEQVVKQVVTGGPLRGADVEEMLPRLLGDGRWRRGGNHRKEFLVAMGIVMSELRGRIDGWRVAARVRPYLCGQPAEGLPPGASPARQP